MLKKDILEIEFGVTIRNKTLCISDENLNYYIIFNADDSTINKSKYKIIYLGEDLTTIELFEFINCSDKFKNYFLEIYYLYLNDNQEINNNKIEKLYFLENFVHFYINNN